MHARQTKPRLVAGTNLPVAKQRAVADEFALQLRGDFVALGHGVPHEHLVGVGVAEKLFELREVGRVHDPRLVGEDVQVVTDGGEHHIDLRAVPTRKHDRVAGLLAEEAVEVLKKLAATGKLQGR